MATWMNLENIVLNEVSQTEKDKCYVISLICEIYLMNLFTKEKQTHRHRKQTYGYQSGIKKMWFICAKEYYSVIKKDKSLPFATT